MKNIQIQEYFAEDKGLNRYFLINKYLYEKNNFDLTKNKKIIEKNILNFSLDINKLDMLNIACLDDNQRLLYLTKDKNQWSKKVITKIQSFYKVNDIKLYSNLNNESTINIFLLVNDTRNRNEYSIFSYTINNTSWSLNKVTDFYYDNYNPIFKSDIDNMGNLHILFKTKESNKYYLYYKMYNVKYNKWGLSEKIAQNTKDLLNPLILCDTTNNIYVAWSSILDKNIKVHFIKREIDLYRKAKWKSYKTLPSNISYLTNPVLIQTGTNIKFGWKRNNFYNFAETKLDKDDWKKVSSVKLDSSKPLIPISFIGNKYKNFDTLKAPYTYLYLSNDNRNMLGIDKIDNFEVDVKRTLQHSVAKNISNNTQNKFPSEHSNYLDKINLSIEKSTLVNDICSISKPKQESNDLNSFIEKLNNLYREIESVKNKELTLLNSILEIRKSNNKLYRKIEEIINDYHESSLIVKDK